MKSKTPSEQYLETAKNLSREEAERVFSRMGGKLTRRIEDRKVIPLDAVALQLEREDQHLQEWRARLAELRAKHKEKG